MSLLEVKTGLSRLSSVNVKESVGWLALSLLYSSTKASTTTTLSDRSTIRQSLKLCKKYLYTYTRIKCIKSDSDSKQSGNLSQNKFTLRTWLLIWRWASCLRWSWHTLCWLASAQQSQESFPAWGCFAWSKIPRKWDQFRSEKEQFFTINVCKKTFGFRERFCYMKCRKI